MSLFSGFKDFYDSLFHPLNDLPPEAFMTSREFEELFAATEEEEWEDEQ